MSFPDQRKLIAILYADVDGYSRMMGEDASATVKSLTRTRELFTHQVSAMHGRVVNAPGDSILVEFSSAVDAVACAMTIQSRLSSQNKELPDQERMAYRIGVSLGDVIVKAGELFGDGVNIAARVESLTPVGGVCITRPVYDQVKQVLGGYHYRYTGRHQVKNIKEPVWIYEVLETPDDNFDDNWTDPGPEPASSSVLSRSTTIAVLPFENFSNEQETDYFSRGFTEDLMTDIAHFRNLQVISSYTSSKICKKDTDELRVSRELGIDYLLRGALIRRKGQIRITTQLIDTETGNLLWAEKYDSPLDDIFDIQDDIVKQVSGAISIQIDNQLLAKARKKASPTLEAYDYWLQGMEELRNGSTETDQKARRIFEKALAIDPYYSRAYTGISLSYFNDWSCQVTDQWDNIGKKAYEYATKAVSLDSGDHMAQLVIGRILMFRKQFDQAEEHLDRSIALNPNDADSLVKQASCKAFMGKPEQGEQIFLKALSLNPYHNLWYYTHGALTYFVQKKYETCIDTALKGPLTEEWIDLPAFIAAAYAHLDENEKALHYLKIFIRAFTEKISKGRKPDPSEILEWCTLANPFRFKVHLDLYINGLIIAGLEGVEDGRINRPPEPQDNVNRFKTDGQVWEMVFKGQSVQLAGVKGFADIAQLLAQPGEEFHCARLMGIVDSFSGQDPMVDDKAKKTYQNRIRDLQARIEKADRNNDLVRSQNLRAELDSLTNHLVSAFGLGSRSRNLSPDTERARSAVTWRIRSAIKKIKARHPELGRHLSHSITTGTFCSYNPEDALSWQL